MPWPWLGAEPGPGPYSGLGVCAPLVELVELLTVLDGVGVCATTGARSLDLRPLAGALDEPVSRVADGALLFFLPNKNDILRCQMDAVEGLMRSRGWKGQQSGPVALHGVRSTAMYFLLLGAVDVKVVLKSAEKQL